MYLVAAALFVLSGLFYSASHDEIGSVGLEVCRYGDAFCQHPHFVLAGAVIAALWGSFVSMR